MLKVMEKSVSKIQLRLIEKLRHLHAPICREKKKRMDSNFQPLKRVNICGLLVSISRTFLVKVASPNNH